MSIILLFSNYLNIKKVLDSIKMFKKNKTKLTVYEKKRLWLPTFFYLLVLMFSDIFTVFLFIPLYRHKLYMIYDSIWVVATTSNWFLSTKKIQQYMSWCFLFLFLFRFYPGVFCAKIFLFLCPTYFHLAFFLKHFRW